MDDFDCLLKSLSPLVVKLYLMINRNVLIQSGELGTTQKAIKRNTLCAAW